MSKAKFEKDFGEWIAEVSLDEEDGVSADVKEKNDGHFTFHEYKATNLLDKVVKIVEIFDEHGNYKR